MKRPLVIINCLTYNHAPYIRQCLEGFVMQQTNFPFYAVVHDDASTDDTQSVIREYAEKYPDIIHPILEKENLRSKHDTTMNNLMTQYLSPAKYIALCEGDDYWTDPYKLQKQVDFLETHPDYSLCCHRYKIYNQNQDTWSEDYVASLFAEQAQGFTFTAVDNYNTWITKTMTLMYRRECLDLKQMNKYKYARDVHWNYYLLHKGRGYCMPFVGAVYRRHAGGVFSALTAQAKEMTSYKIYEELCQQHPDDEDLKMYLTTLQQVFGDNLRHRIYNLEHSKELCDRIRYFRHSLCNMYGNVAVRKFDMQMCKSLIKGLKHKITE
ncbi:MAG: glycosyltransferase [Paludibacteraceae bacterium]|nr:glycosyltransferase [Paludibacteraceae bacterium]